MTSARFRILRRPGLLTAAALSLGLTGVLTQQLLPTTAAADQPRVRAAAAQDPTVVEPSPAPVTVVVPEDVPDEQLVDDAPTAAPVATSVPTAAPNPKPVAKPVAPAKPRPAPKKKEAAPASDGDVCSGPGWQQRRGQRALASLRYPTPGGVTVSFLGGRSGYLGLTYPARRHVDMFVRSCSAESSSLLRHVMAHEMGHAYDAAHMTSASRAAYMAMRGIPAGTPWFGCAYCSDFATPAGDFAETYSQWQRGSSDNRSRLAPAASSAALARLGATFFSR
jgi:hypothetical protein